MIIKGVSAKAILDSRKEKTVQVSIKTNVGDFSASSPSGKSTGKYEVKIYKKNLGEDIKSLKKFDDYFSDEIIEKFDDLRRIEDIVEGHIGGNTLLALESCVLKALAKEQKKQIWELINPKAKHSPRLVGNCVGGGKHSELGGKRPDFQEFLLVPNKKSVKENWEVNKNSKKQTEQFLKEKEKNFKNKKNDEDAWMTELNEKEIFDLLGELNLPLGVDIAASSFYKRKKYHYLNPKLDRIDEEQLGYLSNLIKNFNLFYVEDPFDEEDFESFSKLTKKFPNSLIVGDDLTVTNSERFDKAITMKSINAIIVKPNQCGSLLEVKRVCEMAKKNNIKIVFSHRSGETTETILADLAFGFEADFFKCGITGKEREAKIERLIEIENHLRNL
ncbi:MAG: enolase C-terminal domain-like protein [Nanoarchaeota archaeon]